MNSQYLFLYIPLFLFSRRIIVDFLIYIFILLEKDIIFALLLFSSMCAILNHSVCMSRCKFFLSLFPYRHCVHIRFCFRSIHAIISFTQYTRTTHSFVFYNSDSTHNVLTKENTI